VAGFEMGSEDDNIRTVIADGDPLARRMMRDMLLRESIAIVAEATTGQEAVDLTAFYGPDVVLIDEELPGLKSADATAKILAAHPGVAVVVLAADPDDARGMRALRAGASGYLSKEFEHGVLARVVRGVLDGEAGVSRRLAMRLLESDRRLPRGGAGLRPVRSPLTDREWEVLDLVASGAGTDEIARILVLSTETVRSHLKNLYRKLGVRSRGEAAAAAARMRDLVS
jgi:two-component system, NarL family, response regulator LiaR